MGGAAAAGLQQGCFHGHAAAVTSCSFPSGGLNKKPCAYTHTHVGLRGLQLPLSKVTFIFNPGSYITHTARTAAAETAMKTPALSNRTTRSRVGPARNRTKLFT